MRRRDLLRTLADRLARFPLFSWHGRTPITADASRVIISSDVVSMGSLPVEGGSPTRTPLHFTGFRSFNGIVADVAVDHADRVARVPHAPKTGAGRSAVTDIEPEVRLASGLPIDQAHSIYARTGRVHIGSVLDDAAAWRAHRCLANEVEWQLHFNEGERVYDLSRQQVAALAPNDWNGLLGVIHRNAARGFQYLFNNFPLSDEHDRGRHLDLYVMRVYEFVNSPDFLDFARRLTGVETIAMADAQATCYQPGHFLTPHDDAIDGRQRVAAWVLNLTPEWRVEWGGILQFVDGDGHVAEGYTPRFNALNVFRVPQQHAVSCVSPFAPFPRFSLSGWLREG